MKRDTEDQLRTQCGAFVADVFGFRTETFYGYEDGETISSAIVCFKADGITTVISDHGFSSR